jgi:hypothetical protein
LHPPEVEFGQENREARDWSHRRASAFESVPHFSSRSGDGL